METLFDTTSLSKLFAPNICLIEAFMWRTIVYLVLFVLLRILAQRGSLASASLTDFLVLVLVTSAVQNAVSGPAQSITDGVILAAIVTFWSYALDFLSYHFKPIRRILYLRPMQLIENDEFRRENIQRNLIDEDQLRAVPRIQGYEDPDRVREASIECNGQISVISLNGE